MTQRAWIVGLVIAGLATAFAYGLLWPTPPIMPSDVIATHQAPARHCEQYPRTALKALRDGSQQAVVVVKAFTPPAAGGGSLVVTFTAPNGQRHELGRFAVHPLRAFTAQEAGRQQRFPFSLSGVGHLVTDGQPLCLEVAFAGGETARGGQAEISIELEKKP